MKQNVLQCRHHLLNYLNQHVTTTMQSHFSYIAYLNQRTVYMIYENQRCYLKASPEIISLLHSHQCQHYYHAAKDVQYNHYYDVSAFVENDHQNLISWIKSSVNYLTRHQKQFKKQLSNRPMLKRSAYNFLRKSGVTTFEIFQRLGAIESFLLIMMRHPQQETPTTIFWTLVCTELNCFEVTAQQKSDYLAQLQEKITAQHP